jgi:tRNA 2-thiouridine synthesizing protein E
MHDLNDSNNSQHVAIDADGHLQQHLDWSPEVAAFLAAKEGLVLSEAHLQVLHTTREFYTRFGYAPATRPLIKFLIKELGNHINNAQLMQDFQTGLVARTLARLAGLPKPANCL